LTTRSKYLILLYYFLFNGISYLPDFYLPNFDLYIEVKGRKKEIDIKKVRTAKSCGFNVLLWDGEELLKLGIINNAGSTEINRKYKKN